MKVTEEDTVSTIKPVTVTVFYRNTVETQPLKLKRFQGGVTELVSHMKCVHGIIQVITAKKYKLEVHTVPQNTTDVIKYKRKRVFE